MDLAKQTKQKTKIIILSVALLICVNFFGVPTTVYAAEETTDDNQHTAPSMVEAEIEDNKSETVFLAPPAPEQPPASNNITPDGQGEVLDHLTNEDNIEFITIETPSGNIFYLIIDHTRPNNNVYFLNSVNEWDLLALAAEYGNRLKKSERRKEPVECNEN